MLSLLRARVAPRTSLVARRFASSQDAPNKKPEPAVSPAKDTEAPTKAEEDVKGGKHDKSPEELQKEGTQKARKAATSSDK